MLIILYHEAFSPSYLPMPKITTSTSTVQLRVTVSRPILDQYREALSMAEKVGLRVDVQTDFEKLLQRLTKAIMDAVHEAAPPPSQHDQT